MKDNSKCLVLVPVIDRPERETDDLLHMLNQRGYPVHIAYGFANVDLARSQMASMALDEGFEELFWIDADIVFKIEDFEKIRSYDLPIVCGVYAKKQIGTEMTIKMPLGSHTFNLGQGGGLLEVELAPTGFLYTHRIVYETMKDTLCLPSCIGGSDGRLFHPYFMPFIVPNDNETDTYVYLCDDGSFSYRARQCGFKIMADTTIRLGHIGKYTYSWEEITQEKRRLSSLTCHIDQR